MLKLLITGFIIYFMYRFFIAPVMLEMKDNDRDAPAVKHKEAPKKAKDDDYIDYEEVN